MAFVESLEQEVSRTETVKPEGKDLRSSAQTRQLASPGRTELQSQPAAPPVTPAETATGTPTQEDRQASKELESRWPQILGTVRRQAPNTYGLLNSCKSRHLKGNVLLLGFASDVLKNQMSKQENLEIVQKALAQVLGSEIIVRCTINTARRTALPAEVDNDGMVAAALRDLGGEIVDVQ
jgi:hypothetical protein